MGTLFSNTLPMWKNDRWSSSAHCYWDARYSSCKSVDNHIRVPGMASLTVLMVAIYCAAGHLMECKIVGNNRLIPTEIV